jgi:putative ABC transport system permease protein
MSSLRRLLRRIYNGVRPGRAETDLAREVSSHLALMEDDLRRRGMTPHEARLAAAKALGGVAHTKDLHRDARSFMSLDLARRDAVYAMRALLKTPGFSATIVLTLALGIGANAAMFSILDGLMLRTLPVTEPRRLVLVSDSVPTRLRVWSYPVWQEIRRRPALFATAGAWSAFQFDLASGGETQLVDGVYATGSFFGTLGVPAILGRTFSDADDQRGGGLDGPVAVISYGFWQRRFGGDAGVIGRALRIEGVPFTVIGVTPPDFFGAEVGRTFDVMVPMADEPLIRGLDSFLDSTGSSWLRIIARLKPGQSPAAATAGLRGVQLQIREATLGELARSGSQDGVERYLKSPFAVIPADTGASDLRGSYRRPLLTLLVVVTLVLLIACVNIANLLLARAAGRTHELSVRLALGASRWRVAGQLFTESLMLATAGGACGLVAGGWSSRLLVRALSTSANTVFLDLSMNVRVLAFVVLVTLMTTVLFGTLPAFRASGILPTDALKDQGRGTARNSLRGMAGWLVIAQVALSMILLVAAGLFLRSFSSLTGRSLGFQADQVLVVTVDPHRSIVEPGERTRAYERIRDAVRALPNVADAAISMVTPFGRSAFTPRVDISGLARFDTQYQVWGNVISPEWFDTFGTRLMAGRGFSASDRQGAPRVAVINEVFARQYFDGRALGHTITLYPRSALEMPPMEIVGVVADTVWSLHDAAPPMWYAPLDQFDPPAGFDGFTTARLSVRPKHGAPFLLTKDVATAIAAVNPQFGLTFHPLSDQVHASVTQDRLTALLAGFFGVLALLLASIGMYGLVAYGVAQRRVEIGIRMALGAGPGNVMRLVLARTAGLVGAGVIIGTATSLWASKFIAALIFGLQPHDPTTVMGAGVVLAAAAVVAGWLPARRAVRIDPAAVLRDS